MNRVPEMLRLLYRLALVVAMVVCTGVLGGGGTASLEPVANLALAGRAAPTKATAEGTTVTREASSSDRSHYLRDSNALAVVDPEALESDIDDDDLAHDSPLAFKGASFPRVPARARHGQTPRDASRFTIDTGLARGPPT